MEEEDSEVDYLLEAESVIEHYQSKLRATSVDAFEDLKEHVTISNSALTLDLLKKRCTLLQTITGIYHFFESADLPVSSADHILQLLVTEGKIPSRCLTNKRLTSTLPPSTLPVKDSKAESTCRQSKAFNKSSTVVSGSISKSTTSTQSSSRSQLSHNAASTSVIIPAQKAPVVSALLPESLDITSGARDSIVELAKQEVHVLQRIAELRKNGMWSIRRLPKVAEPSRVKAHWDYLLEEMSWLAADFMQERKWKRNSAKKCSKMITKYHSLKGGQAQRIEKEEQIKLRRIASNIAKMVKTFWSEIEKLVEHKQEVQLKEKRKKIHDMQLRFIVDKADHFTEKLTQEFVTPSLKNSRAPSVDSDQMLIDELEVPQTRKNNRINELKRKELELSKDPDENDAEFEKGSSCSDDDEETIAKEEDQETKETMDPKVELNELESEANIPIEELLSRYGYDSEMANSEQTNYTTAEEETEMDETDSEETSNENENIDITYLVNNVDNNDSGREITEADAAAAAESIQPKGNTLSSVEVITKVPFLLKFQLREYQHIGLDWLVAMNEKNLNGILADEMGLGKTIQTISLIAHLACEKGIWGPHLIVVPTSVMLNWEMEIKKWCPALKVLTYYGNPKERRMKRKGWTKQNTFHVCITSYKLVVQDHSSFRRKKWVYFILDEAQHIKNFKSQRWQMLLNFNSARRLLLTGTPLQNNLMELWSLMHFLMPNVFQSHREFKDWFVNPVTGMIEGNQENDEIIRRLHKILRPFLLRRLKCDVEKQLPKKYEHIVQCSLSKRQRQLYDEYMGEGETKATLASGNFLSVINILMQLRKVCNHPNLFDPRPTISPFIDQEIVYRVSSLVNSVLDYQPLSQIDLSTLNLVFSQLSTELTTLDHRTIECFQLDPAQMENCLKSEPQSKVYARLSSFDGFNRWLKKSLKPNLQTSNRSIFQISSFSKDINQGTSNCDVEMELETDGSSIIQSPTEGTLGIGKYAKKEIIARIEQLRKDKLRKMMVVNKRRCALNSLYPKDCIDAVNLRNETSVFISHCDGGQSSSLFSIGNGFSQCLLTQTSSLNSDESSNALREMLHTPSSLESSFRPILERYLCIVPSVLASPLKLTITHLPSYKQIDECNFAEDLSSKLPTDFFDVTVVPRIQLRFQLPEIRLIQYDCGKLQTLDQLLWKLKAGNHRVLIFTQMSRMLDIFEQFLNYHGHTYLRLDGSTKIEQRQALMERFNADQRIFCFILSTRSGGVGVNLTGADTVIFYDSDWNPTMDAQAQDRCHRIGQTRDVHIYRLVSERTVEENILRKAQQKKLLGDLAIEEGNFTTAFFKQAAIQELFEIDQSNEPTEVISNPPGNTQQSSSADLISEMGNAVPVNYRNAFEQALGTAEEETDVAAAKEVRAEAAAEFIEFDETVPIEDASEEKSPEEEQIEQAISQLLPIERLALQYFESQQDFQELKQVEEEMEETKRQWQKNIKEMRQKHEEERRQSQAQDPVLTYSREDSSIEKVFMSTKSLELMPIWAPPTPPRDEKDYYVDSSICFLYESTLMPESQLPPIYVPKSNKRLCNFEQETSNGFKRRKTVNKVGTLQAPQDVQTGFISEMFFKENVGDLFQNLKSCFKRTNSSHIHLCKDQLLIKFNLWPGCSSLIFTAPNSKSFQNVKRLQSSSDIQQKSMQVNLSRSSRWLMQEDMAMIKALLYLQELPCNLSTIHPGYTPNWDFVAEQVNTYSPYKRSEEECKYRYESIVSDDNYEKQKENQQSKINKKPRKQKAVAKKHQTETNTEDNSFSKSSATQSTAASQIIKTLNSAILDNNAEFTQVMNNRFDAIKRLVNSKRQPQFRFRNKQQELEKFDHQQYLRKNFNINTDHFVSIEELAHCRTESNLEENEQVNPNGNDANLPNSLELSSPVHHQQPSSPKLFLSQSSSVTSNAPANPLQTFSQSSSTITAFSLSPVQDQPGSDSE